MIQKRTKWKVALSLIFLAFLIVSKGVSARQQARTKKELMVEMGKQYGALDQKMLAGANSNKFADQDFQAMSAQCDELSKLANEYAKTEGKGDLAEIAKGLATSLDYLKQQMDRKEPIVVVSTFGRVLSFCAECHYQSRWTAAK